MTKMLNIYPSTTLPNFDLALSEYYNSLSTTSPIGIREMVERATPLSDNVHIGNGDTDGNFYFRFFRTAQLNVALVQDAHLALRKAQHDFLA